MQQLELFDYRKDYLFESSNQIAHYYDILKETEDTISYAEHIDPKKGYAIAGSGNKRQSFVANGRIKNVIENKTTVIDDNQEFKQVLFYVEFENMKIFDQEINIKDHMDNLNFIKNKDKYGLYFQGGICKINKESYEYIVNKH